MRDNEQAFARRITNGDVAVLANRLIRIIERRRQGIIEGCGSFLKGNAVLLEIPTRLVPVPFELHGTTLCLSMILGPSGKFY